MKISREEETAWPVKNCRGLFVCLHVYTSVGVALAPLVRRTGIYARIDRRHAGLEATNTLWGHTRRAHVTRFDILLHHARELQPRSPARVCMT